MEYFTININGNGERVSGMPLSSLADEQFKTLCNLISAEQLDRDVKRQKRADEWICDSMSTIELR